MYIFQPEADVERQMLVERIDQLTSDKEGLLTRLECCEDELKTASECEDSLSMSTSSSFVIFNISVDNERQGDFGCDGRRIHEVY